MPENNAPVPSRGLTPLLVSRIDRLAMLTYVILVYGWSLWLYPLGRDFTYLARAGQDLPFIVKQVFAFETAQFGTALFGYHLVNIGLMYGCMLLLYRFVNAVLAGPVWFGTLASTLFMSNPAHSEAMLNLCGAVDLIPCFFALAFLAAYAAADTRSGAVRSVIAMVTFALAVFPYYQNAGLVLVIAAYEVFIARRRKRLAEILVYVGVAVAAVILHRSMLLGQGFSLERAFVPLYFLFYPIGFLPETVRLFHDQPWLAWLAAVATLVILFLICRKARRKALIFGLVAMAVARIPQSGQAVDSVHLVGGGQLLLANALFVVAFSAFFYRIMENPNWRTTVIAGTTALCMVYFGVEIREIAAWRHAGQQVQEFQRRATTLAAERAGESIGVLPDYQYYLSAPMCLSQSIAHDTLFSKAIAADGLLPLHYGGPGKVNIELDAWDAQGGVVRAVGARPIEILPQPCPLSQVGSSTTSANVSYEVAQLEEYSITVRVKPAGRPLPIWVLSIGAATGALPGKEAAR